ncbi:MAG: hypothetical protein HRT71_22100 [Flavobacteriales bacterium]|nr:hypothetical protein [Flavobacteriales bacterium]
MERINFKEVRDLGGIVDVTSKFLTQNFVKIVKLSAILALGPIISGAILISISMVSLSTLALGSTSYGLLYVLGMLFVVIGFTNFYIVVNCYVVRYVDGQEEITGREIFSDVKSNVLKYFFGAVLFSIACALGFIISVFHPAAGSFAFMIIGVYLGVILSFSFIMMSNDKIGIFASWSKSFKLIKGHWWTTFGTYIVVSFIYFQLVLIAYLPMYILMIFWSFNAPGMIDPIAGVGMMQILMIIAMPVYYAVSIAASLVYLIAVALKYYSLEELIEGTGELEEIANLGNTEPVEALLN